MTEKEIHCKIAFGDQQVDIRTQGPVSKSIVDALFVDAPTGQGENPCCRFTLRDEDNGHPTLLQDDVNRIDGVNANRSTTGQCALTLWSELQYHLCNDCTSGLMLHAAAVDIDDQMIIFPGVSGSGKTTLSAHLLAAGARYLTDELTFLDITTGQAHCLTRPFNVKHKGRKIINTLLSSDKDEEAFLRNPVGFFVPHRLIRCPEFTYPAPPKKPAAVVFPRFMANQSLTMEALSQAHCSARLMSCLVNARNLAGDGLTSCRLLAESVPAWTLNYGLDQNPIPLLKQLLFRV